MEQNDLPVLTQDAVLARINIALTKKQLSVQKLQDEADALEFTEENIPVISAYLAKIAAMDKSIEETHKEGKAPYLEGGRLWDAAKNSSLATTAAIKSPVKQKFDKLCAEVEKKKRDAQIEKDRQAAILAGIENNVISFSAKIAACTTNAELLSIERLINLEKSPSNAGKYGEFHTQAVEKYDEVLKPILKDQKEKIQAQDDLKKKIIEAEKTNDVEKLDELNEKLDAVTDEIIQNQVNVQEAAITNAPIEFTPVAEEIFADTKSRRSYTIEIFDEKEALKKAKDLLEITINKDAANVVLKTLKDTGAFKDKPDVVLNGIKYSEIKNYK
ncbi:MAG: hypothetical protein V4547_09580 [Bacteroidota bacterium]